MSTIQINQKQKDQLLIVKKQEQKSERKLQGTIRPQRGHTLFELNLKTKEINQAKFKEKDFVVHGNNNKRKVVIMLPDCIYISALNEKNALKKFFKKIKK